MQDSLPIVVRRRFGRQRLDIREFIRPDSLMVRELVAQLPPDPDAHYLWVVRNIAYPWGDPDVLDRHLFCRFVTPDGSWQVCHESDDMWAYPAEVLADRIGDCDDTSILLVSMLRHLFGPDQVFATVGYWNGEGHVWVVLAAPQGWRLYETTLRGLSGPAPVEWETPPYEPLCRFNDVHAVWVRPAPLPSRVRDPKKTLRLLRNSTHSAA